MGTTFGPFDGESSESIGDLTIECADETISIYGSMTITRDRRGLAAARSLRDALIAIVLVLAADGSLPDRVGDDEEPPGTAANPLI